MSSQNVLELTLDEILHVVNPSREDWEARMRIINELKDAVSTIESLRGATVEPFGSFLSQLFTRWGDLDISIELSNGAYISIAAKKYKQTLLADVQKVLRKTGSFRRLQFVIHARVPILKLESKCQNISCDISINNLSGQMKSKFLLWISLIDRRFRDMVLLVKEWAKANDINNPKTGTFNSYSLSLLVIFHFQTCIPAILPPLKDVYPGNMADELQGIRADVETRIEAAAAANIAKFRKARKVNRSSVSELFTSFFAKFSDISTRAADQGICTFTGQWEDISTNTRWLPRTYAIFIEDPFEQPENTARAVASGKLTRIAEVFTNTYHRLIAPNQTRNTLIPLLVRHEIYHFFQGVAFRNGSTSGGSYFRTNQNMRHDFQHQYQKTRQVSHLNNVTARKSKQSSQGQALVSHPNNANRSSIHASQGQTESQRVTGQGAVQASQGQAQLVPPQQVKPQLPHTALPGRVNNVSSSQRPVKVSQGQTQQIWRPKQSD